MILFDSFRLKAKPSPAQTRSQSGLVFYLLDSSNFLDEADRAISMQAHSRIWL